MKICSAFLSIAGALVLTCKDAPAADLGSAQASPTYKSAQAPASVFGWNGFYVGGNIGYGQAQTSNADFPGSGHDRLNGVIGGAQAGYNWQADSWIVGLETDFQYSGQKFSDDGETDKLSWLGTTRLRAGLAVDRWFLYGTGGAAYGQFKISGTTENYSFTPAGLVAVTLPLGGAGSKLGWTAGAGVEAAINKNWSLKAEYLYVDLGTASLKPIVGGVTYEAVRFHANDQLVRTGINYHF